MVDNQDNFQSSTLKHTLALLFVIFITLGLGACGGGSGGGSSSDDGGGNGGDSNENDSYSLERSIGYTTAYRGYCEFSDSSKREIMIETNDLDSDFIILIKYVGNGNDELFTARAYIDREPIIFSQYEEKSETIDGGNQWEGEFSSDRKTVTGTIDGGKLAMYGCDFTTTLDNNANNDSSSYENNVTIGGITIPLALSMEDEIFSQKVIEWNDDVTFSYLENNKKVISYLSSSDGYRSYPVMDGFWDVREDSNELWVVFNDGDLYRFEITTDGNNYVQYITRINSDAKLTHIIGEPSQLLLEQIDEPAPDLTDDDTTSEEPTRPPVTSTPITSERIDINYFIGPITEGQPYRYSQNNGGMNAKILSINNSASKVCYFIIESARLNWAEGSESMDLYYDIFSINDPSAETSETKISRDSQGRYRLTSSYSGEDIEFAMNYSVYSRGDNYVDFRVDCESK